MKILFLMRHVGSIRNYRSVLDLLVSKGHKVVLAFNMKHRKYGPTLYDQLLQQISTEVTVVDDLAPCRCDMWSQLSTSVLFAQDYLRYFDPRYKDAHKLKARVEKRVPKYLSRFINRFHPKFFIKFLIKCSQMIESVIPPSKQISMFIQKYSPDMVLVTPYVDLKSDQVDYVKSAKLLKIKTVLCVSSWDNLTNKGSIKVQPDKIIVWNENQKQEALAFHDSQPSQVIVTGAQCFDHWFNRSVSTTLNQFCAKVGFSDSRNFLLYLCSSPFIAPEEVSIVTDWIRAIRACNIPELKDIPILIRPHPQNTKQWEGVTFAFFENVVIYPPLGANPVNEETKSVYFDSLYHSCAVVGVNTSAMIEAGIVGKPVFTIISDKVKDTQEGTLHFHHLVKGGLLYIGQSIDEHIGQLESVLMGSRSYTDKIRQFIHEFVRPHGLDIDATSIFVRELECIYTDTNSLKQPSVLQKLWRILFLIPVMGLMVLMNLFHPSKRSKKKISGIKKRSARLFKRVRKKPIYQKINTAVNYCLWGLMYIPRYIFSFRKYVQLYGKKVTIKLYKQDIKSRLSRHPINKKINYYIQQNTADIPGGPTRKNWLYHDYVIPGMILKSQRKNNFTRLQKIREALPKINKSILDIGCSSGGVSLGLALMGAKRVYGVDYDVASIRLAKKVAQKYQIKRVLFHACDLAEYQYPKVDIIVWLSNWMWIVKQHGIEYAKKLLFDVPQKTGAQYMIFESAADDGKAAIAGMTQDKLKNILQEYAPFEKVIDLGPFKDKWRKPGQERNVFICKGSTVVFKGKKAMIRRLDENTVIKEYEDEILWAKKREAECLRQLSESPYFPRLLEEGENWIKMEWAGDRVKNANQLNELENIIKTLEDNDIVHRDICPQNLLYKNGKLSLIDFGWAIVKGNKPPVEPPRGLGRGFYEYGNWNDSLAAQKVRQFFSSRKKKN